MEEIRRCIEVFSHGNMPYVLMATRARLLLEGATWEVGGDPGAPRPGPGWPKPPLMEAHHADAPTRAVYDDVKSVLGLPFVNTDYRAVARWPSYFALAWSDLRRIAQAAAYEPAVAATHQKAIALAEALPNPSGLSAEMLIAAANTDATHGEVLEVVRLFRWLLPALAVNVACLRAQLGPSAA